MLPKALHPEVQHAVVIATYLHATQVDKSGVPYITHPLAILDIVLQELPEDYIAQAASVLHDVIEDCGQTVQSLIALGVRPETAELVGALSKRKGEPYEEFIRRISVDRRLRVIKRADMWNNTEPSRLAKLPPEDADRLRKKYARGFEILGFSEETMNFPTPQPENELHQKRSLNHEAETV
jgi:(p)ppGpp synthase/HD superfamily hydrolase